MNDMAIKMIIEALRDDRPLVLLAGQELDTASDAVLQLLLDRLQCNDHALRWRAAIDCGMTRDDMTWLSERFDRTVPSDAASAIFDVGWSAVFTSTIDPQFARRFETRGRQPEQVLSKQYYPKAPRSRSRPPIYYLLGRADDVERDACAPITAAALEVRIAQHTSDLLTRITETATPHGIVIVAGYSAGRDWLPLDRILASLYTDGRVKILWFGNVADLSTGIAKLMAKEQSLIPVSEHLSTVIQHLIRDNRVDFTRHAAPDEPGIVSLVGDKKLNITPALRLQIESSASIVDDEWTESPHPLDDNEIYRDFRQFHASLDNFRLLVSGILRGFAIERDFEKILMDMVSKKLRRLGHHDVDDVIILHGQSGTGKTVALARLAHNVRASLRLPVVVATNRIPNQTDVDAFCLEIEHLDVPATILICDTGQDPWRCYDIASALRSRGRRLLIVATSYRIDAAERKPPHGWIEAPATVSDMERGALRTLLLKFGLDLPQAELQYSNDPQDLIALFYRYLPSSREAMASGLSREARIMEDTIRQRAKNVPRPTRDHSQLAHELVRTGLVAKSMSLFCDDPDIPESGRDAAARLVNQVMAAGRLNCAVPINLIFRSLTDVGGLGPEHIHHIFHDVDLFRWRSDNEKTDFLVAPRIQLEAELICRRRLAPSEEINCLIDLISHVRFGVDARAERAFLLDLISKIRRTGPRGATYQKGYLRFADALRQVRQANNATFDPDLVLQECVLRRQAVYDSSDRTPAVAAEADRLAVLDEARNAIDATLHHIKAKSTSVRRRTKQRLLGERSAIYGYLAVQYARSERFSIADDQYWSYYLAARVTSDSAIGLGEDYHTIDIALWTARDVLEKTSAELSEEQKAEILADLYSTIDIADDMFGVGYGGIGRYTAKLGGADANAHQYGGSNEGTVWLDQKTRYLEKRAGVAKVARNSDLARDTIAELEETAPEAATFLVAKRSAIAIFENDAPYDKKARHAAEQAATYILRRKEEGKADDDRCQRLLLRLRWAHSTGERLLFRQRGRTPIEREHISEVCKIVAEINERAESAGRNRERFLEAVLCWLLNDFNRAHQIWRPLSRDTEYEDRARVVRWLVATGEDGSPQRFRGRVVPSDGRDWQVRVEGVDRPIALLARDFRDMSIAPHKQVSNFGIAFNYVGPIADPLSRRGR